MDVDTPRWISDDRDTAFSILASALKCGRPIIPLLGTGMSVDAGMPLANELSEYLVQVHAMIRALRCYDSREYLLQSRWPSRHDLRLQLMQMLGTNRLQSPLKACERVASQDALVSELRRSSPTLASSLAEIFDRSRSSDLHTAEQRDQQQKYSFRVVKWSSERLPGILDELASSVPRNIGYRSLLFNLAQNDQALHDACLDHFMRGREPTTTQQFVVFLSRLFSCRVLLTTNFDFLLERAFENEHISPKLYEMQGDTTIPIPQLLLAQQISIVKLHGGAHQMRLGFDLDNPLDPAVRASFRELFTTLKDASKQMPLLLVMGYSGSDRRVMDMVTMHIRDWRPTGDGMDDPDNGVNVLWIAREATAPRLLSSAVETHPAVSNASPQSCKYPVKLVTYREGRLFLHEAYQRLAMSFPVAHNSYQALHFVPRSSASKNTGPDPVRKSDGKTKRQIIDELADDDGKFPAVIVLRPENDNAGSSSALADLAGHPHAPKRVIWIDLTELPDVSALFDVLSERLTKIDASLQPIRRPLFLANSTGVSGVIGRTASQYIDEKELEVAARWLSHALRRDHYLVALDSLDEFPGQHLALQPQTSDSLWVNGQLDLLKKLFEHFIQPDFSIGDSRIVIADSSSPPKWLIDAHAVLIPTHPKDPWDNNAAFEDLTRNRDSQPDEYYILTIAACCRRIRSEVLLSSVYLSVTNAPLAERRVNDELWKGFLIGLTETSPRAVVNWANDLKYVKVAAAVRKIAKSSISRDERDSRWFFWVEGGYYWMHRPARDNVYQKIRESFPHFLIAVHDRIAQFYYDAVFLRSSDPRAFLESLFHRTAAIEAAYRAGLTPTAQWWGRRARDSILRDKPLLQSQARIPSLIHQIRQLIDVLLSNRTDASEDLLVISNLLGVLSDLLTGCGHPHSAVHCQAARLRLLVDSEIKEGNLHEATNSFEFEKFSANADAAFEILRTDEKQDQSPYGYAHTAELVWTLSDSVIAAAAPISFGRFPSTDEREWLRWMALKVRTDRIA